MRRRARSDERGSRRSSVESALRSFFSEAIRSTKSSLTQPPELKQTWYRLASTWSLYLCIRTCMAISTDLFSDEMVDGTISLADVTLTGCWIQFVVCLIWSGAAFMQNVKRCARAHRFRMADVRVLSEAWEDMGFNCTIALKHFLCGVCNITDNVCFLGAIVSSSAAYASTLSLTSCVFFTLLMLYVILQKAPSAMQLMLIVPLVSSAVAFSGMQSEEVEPLEKKEKEETNFPAAFFLIIVSAVMNSICTVYGQAAFCEGAAQVGRDMTTSLRQLSDLLGSLIPLLIFKLSKSVFGNHGWTAWSQPLTGHTLLLAALFAAETISFKLTCQVCGAVSIALAKCFRLGTIYMCKVLILGGEFNLWEALSGLTVCTLAVIYVLGPEVANMQAKARLVHLLEEISERAWPGESPSIDELRQAGYDVRSYSCLHQGL